LGGSLVEPPILARSVIGGSRIFRRWCLATTFLPPESSTGQKIDLISGCRGLNIFNFQEKACFSGSYEQMSDNFQESGHFSGSCSNDAGDLRYFLEFQSFNLIWDDVRSDSLSRLL